jgi:hypothetical protein
MKGIIAVIGEKHRFSNLLLLQKGDRQSDRKDATALQRLMASVLAQLDHLKPLLSREVERLAHFFLLAALQRFARPPSFLAFKRTATVLPIQKLVGEKLIQNDAFAHKESLLNIASDLKGNRNGIEK